MSLNDRILSILNDSYSMTDHSPLWYINKNNGDRQPVTVHFGIPIDIALINSN